MSYGGNLDTSDLDLVRFYLGDTDPASELLTDGEINALLVSYDAVSAAAIAARSLGARFARQADMQVGDLRINYSQLSKQFFAIVDSLPVPGETIAGASVWAGGLSRAEKAANNANSDLVKHSFRRGMHRNINAPEPPYYDASE